MITTRVKVLAGILVASLLFLIYDTVQRSSQNKQPGTAQAPVTQTVATPPAPRQARAPAPSSPRRLASTTNPLEGWGRNPFLPPASEDEVEPAVGTMAEKPGTAQPEKTFAIPELRVSAITWTSGQARALINGRILGVGDVIEGMLIMEIEEAAVTLRGGGRTLTLEVGT